jgi:hypothetical protein
MRLLIGLLALSLAVPPVSHGFGLLRYVFDALSNQLGLDRGPIPKATPETPIVRDNLKPHTPGQPPEPTRIHIQAEGY